MYSKPIQQLITAFSKLPGVGERTAERYVFYLLKSGKKDVAELTLALKNLISEIKSCEICWDFSDKSPCNICANSKRERQTICVVAEPQDVQALEKTGEYTGVYHVLRGVIDSDQENLQELKVNELFKKAKNESLLEVIMALNPDLKGETTAMFLEKQLKKINPKIKITRLARGLPMGSDMQYADEITLGKAIKNRTTN